MSKVVRSSKFRHVFGSAAKTEDCYGNVKVSKNAWDSNYAAVNSKYLALCWQTGGGGAAGVIPLKTTGKLDNIFTFNGHTGPVLDLAFSPFNESLLATASEDCTVKIWSIPEGGLKSDVSDAVQVLKGHGRKAGTVGFNPVADNILVTSAIDFKVKVWDIEKGEQINNIEGHGGIIQSVEWNLDGSLLTTFSKDKKLRIIDPRTNSVTGEVEAHAGIKGGRATWLGDKDKIFSAGFSKTTERQFSIWDPRNFTAPLVETAVDNSAGIFMPFYDNSSAVLFLAGKGDSSIKYYEIVEDSKVIYFLSQYTSNQPQQGCACLPKRAVDVSTNEICRIYKAMQNVVEPISFRVPRKSDIFQEDLFPECPSDEPALSADEWSAGKNSLPKMQSMAPGFVSSEKKEKNFNPVVQSQTGPQSETELKEELEKLTKRVAYLEAEGLKKDAIIKSLQN